MKKIFIAITFLISPSIWAATIDEQRETTGYGSTYQEALSGALLEAVRQVSGLEVGTEKVLRTSISSSINAAGHSLIAKEQVATDIYTKSKGRIKTYKIIKVKKPSGAQDQWQVDTLVTVPVYKEAIKNDTRKSIAVLPFEVVPSKIITYKVNVALNNITSRIADSITSELNQSRKFAVLNRSFEKQLNKERAMLASDKVSPAEASRLGRKLGADFIVLGKIYQLDFSKKTKDYYGMKNISIESTVDLYYTVIEAATEKVMWSDTFTYKHNSSEENEAVGEFTSGLSATIVTNILDVIYPIKIMQLAGKERVLLNQGGKRLSEGQIMEVYTTGTSIMDPDTGMAIKIDGSKVAELEVTQVKPKYSIAKLVQDSGRYSDLAVNAITRRATEDSGSTAAPERELTSGSSDAPVNWGL